MTDITRLPFGDGREGMLPADERTRILAAEEYRFEIRHRLEGRAGDGTDRNRFWKEKLFVPAIVAIMTLILSEWAVPRAIELTERSKRQTEIATELMQDVAQKVTEMATAADARSSAIDEFWLDSAGINAMVGEFALKRDIGDMTVKEFERQDNLIENDRKRVIDRRDRSADEYARSVRDFRAWLKRTQLRIETVYRTSPERDAAARALTTLAAEVQRFGQELDARDAHYQTQEDEKIRASKNLRSLHRDRKLTRAQYELQATPILEELRTMKPLSVREHAFDKESVAAILQFVQSAPQAP